MNIPLNQASLALFLVSTFVVGLLASRRNETMRDYALANQSLGSGVLVMTLIATLVGVNYVNPFSAYIEGLVSLLPMLCLSFMAVVLGYWVFPKLTAFQNHCTVGDVMQEFYGNIGRIFTVVVSTLFSVLIMACQLQIVGEIAPFFGISPFYLILILGLFTTIYTSIGGIRSVAATDVLQFISIALGIGLFVSIVLYYIYGGGRFGTLLDTANKTHHLDFFSYPNFNTRILNAFFWAGWPTLLITPPVIQRILMTKKKKHIRQMFLSFSFFYPLLRIVILLVGLSLLLVPNVPAISKLTLGNIIELTCSNPIGQLAFLIAIFSVLMSTFDSFLNALAVLWVNDVVLPLTTHYKKPLNIVNRIRIVTIFIGLIVTLFTLYIGTDAVDILFYACLFYSVICIPLLAGIIGFKSSTKSFLASLVAFCIVFFAFAYIQMKFNYFKSPWLVAKNLGGNYTFRSLLRVAWALGILVSTFVFFVAHYLENNGFVIIDRESNRWQIAHCYQLALFSFSQKKMITWVNSKATNHGKEPYLFGMLIYLSSFVPYFGHDKTMPMLYLVLGVRGIGVVLSTILLLESIWPKVLQHYFNLYYFFTICYCIPFTQLVIGLHDPQGVFTMTSIVLGMVLAAILVDRHSFLYIYGTGLLFALLFNKLWSGHALASLGGKSSAILSYNVIYTLFLIVLFVYKREHQHNQSQTLMFTGKKQYKTTSNTYIDIQKQLTDSFHKKSSMVMVVDKAIKLLKKGKANPEAISSIEHAVIHFQQMAIKAGEYLPLKLETTRISTILTKAYYELKAYGIDPSEIVILKQSCKNDNVICDPNHIKELISNGIRYLINSPANPQLITLGIDIVPFSYSLSENGPKVKKALRIVITTKPSIPAPQKSYIKETNKIPPLTSRNIELVKNERIVKAHYGITNIKKDTIQEYVIPLNAKALPKIRVFADELLNKPVSLEAEQDKAFLSGIKQKNFSPKERERIVKALKVIKHYHRNQHRKTGEPFYLHPLAVATILLNYTKEASTVIAALLHDAVEDTPYTHQQLLAMFGNKVANIVNDVTHLYSSNQRKIKLEKEGSLASLFRKSSKDSSLIKLGDRLHNMRTMKGILSKKKREQKAKETLAYFVPEAKKYGFKKMAQELEQLSEDIVKA